MGIWNLAGWIGKSKIGIIIELFELAKKDELIREKKEEVYDRNQEESQ